MCKIPKGSINNVQCAEQWAKIRTIFSTFGKPIYSIAVSISFRYKIHMELFCHYFLFYSWLLSLFECCCWKGRSLNFVLYLFYCSVVSKLTVTSHFPKVFSVSVSNVIICISLFYFQSFFLMYWLHLLCTIFYFNFLISYYLKICQSYFIFFFSHHLGHISAEYIASKSADFIFISNCSINVPSWIKIKSSLKIQL